ncbi:hypothetical protein BJ508DRAFT_416272 [Ascobolus immersus RN42]|uniref:Neurochondrin-domain-containing protein n=1 Tax=Ascobolus immersus RN42 TaxID=1160509 RepID=A0A3N4I4A4_ASCIM|nr:hypothetical protein BJ508DRAFT_416272 [Ascobolus immersus RN42]
MSSEDTATAPQSIATTGAPNEATESIEQSATFEKTITLLKAKSDTQRFVGLSLLLPLLSRLSTPESKQKCLDSIDVRFLDRLLKSRKTEKKSEMEAQALVDLAIGIIHAFVTILPDAANQDRLIGRTNALFNAFDVASDDSKQQVMFIFLVFSTSGRGAAAVLEAGDPVKLYEMEKTATPLPNGKEKEASGSEKEYFRTITYLFTTASRFAPDLAVNAFRQIFPFIVYDLETKLGADKSAEREAILKLLSHILAHVPETALPKDENIPKRIAKIISTITMGPHRKTELSSIFTMLPTILHTYPPSIIFHGSPDKAESEPFTFHLINLLTADILSTFPNLLNEYGTPEYTNTANRLAASFENISVFVSFLVESLSSEDDEEGGYLLPLNGNQLLQVRSSLQDVFSQLLEFIRDRMDKDPEDRTLAKDPIITASVKALCLWLREDDSPVMRKEAAGALDAFLLLWECSTAETTDFRPWLIGALPTIIIEGGKSPKESWRELHGWNKLYAALLEIYKSASNDDQESILLGIEIARFLIGTAALEPATAMGERFIEIVSLLRISEPELRRQLDAWWACLANSCLQVAPSRPQRESAAERSRLQSLSMQLINAMIKWDHQEEIGVLSEVLENLDALDEEYS